MKKKLIQVAVVLVLMALIMGGAGVSMLMEKYRPTTERMDLYAYYGMDKTDTENVLLFLQDEERLPVLAEERLKRVDGALYISYEMVQNECTERFYWDEAAQMMVYTTAYDIYKIPLSASTYTVNGMEKNHDCAIVIEEAGSLYMSIDFVQEYADFYYEYYEAPARVLLYNKWGELETREAVQDGEIRALGGIKSEILADVASGEKLFVCYEMDTWMCVQNMSGIRGYIEKKVLDENVQKLSLANEAYEEPVYPSLAYEREDKVNLVWHQISSEIDGSALAEAMRGINGVNVISPTWFFMCDNDGNLRSLANRDYVNYAHSVGMEVWGLVENMTYDISTYETLSRMESREHLVDELIRYALDYNLDGINVDIEELAYEAGDAYIQFIRELSIECRANGLVLSIANYVPIASNMYYNRKEQGIVADYVIIMGYDEHYAGMSEAGSTASIGFVKDGIENTLKEVPKEKVINAVPFYARVFKQIPESAATKEQMQYLPLVEDSTSEYGRYLLDSTAVSIGQMQKIISDYNVTTTWNEALGQYYGEYTANGCKYLMWLEDETSIGLKVDLIRENDLAGVAAWSLNLAKAGIWDVINEHME